MRQTRVPALSGPGSARRGRRALAAGTALALSASLMGITAPGAHAEPIAGDNWSTAFESGQPQPLNSAPFGTSQNVVQVAPQSNVIVDAVFGTDAPTGNEGVHRLIDTTGLANADKWFVGRKPSSGNPIQAIYTLQDETTVTSYQFISGGDDKPRDPRSWRVFGSNEVGAGTDVNADWTLIDSVNDFDFVRTGSTPSRFIQGWFDVDSPGSYRYYKLQVIDNWSASNQFQLGSWQLHTPTPRFDYEPQSHVTSVVSSAPNAGNPGERAYRLADATPGTKWLSDDRIFGRPTAENPVYVMYTLDEATEFADYIMTMGNDQQYPGQASNIRDPGTWQIFGTNNEDAAQSFIEALPYDASLDPSTASWGGDWSASGSTWTIDWSVDTDEWDEIDSVVGHSPVGLRRKSVVFQPDNPGEYQYLMIQINSAVTPGERVQMADFSLVNALDNPISGLTTELADSRAYETSGTKMLRYSGETLTEDEASAANVVFDDLDLTVGDNTALSYEIRPGGIGGAHVIVDAEYADEDGSNPGFISELPDIKTVDGTAFDTEAQGDALNPAQWNDVTVDLSPLAGKVVNRLVLRYADSEAGAQQAITGLIGTISLSDSPFAGDLALSVVPQVSARSGEVVPGVIGVVTGSGLIDPANSLDATLTLDDDTSISFDLVATATETGIELSLDLSARFALVGSHAATLEVTFDDGTVQSLIDSTDVVVTVDGSVTSRFEQVANLVCVTRTGHTEGFDCDGNGWTYMRDQLDATNWVRGETYEVAIGETQFHYQVPDVADEQPDTIIPAGQVWSIRAPEGTQQISLLGFSNEGDRSRTFSIHYTDGTVQDVERTFRNWDSSENEANTIVVSTVGRNRDNGSTDSATPRIFATTPITLETDTNDDPKTVDYIQLPPKVGELKPEGQVHIAGFATDVVPDSSPYLILLSGDEDASVSVNDELAVTFGSVSGADGTYAVDIDWGDGSAVTAGSVDIAGQVTGSHTYDTPGSYTATATVTSDGQSRVSVVAVTVDKLTSTIDLVGPAISVIGSTDTITATVSPAAATGEVQFAVDGEDVGTPVALDANNEADFDASTLAVGAHSVTATYLGDDIYDGSSSSHQITITKVPSSITISGSGDFLALQSLPIHANVVPVEADRTVNILHDGDVVASGETNAAGAVTIFVSPPVGTTSYGAEVVETETHAAATAPDPVVMTLNKHSVVVLLEVPNDPVEVGTTVDLRVVLPATATGEVQFKNGTQNIGEPVTVGGGVALLQTDSLAAGVYNVTAEYSGDDNNEAAVSEAHILTIVKKTGSVSLAVPTADVLIGDDVTVTATVPAGATGTVTFLVDGDAYGTPVPVSDDAAVLTLEDLALGTYTVTAQYSGDGTYEAATSSEGTFDVVKRAGSISLTGPTSDVVIGDDVTVTATVLAGATGTVTFLVDGDVNGDPVAVSDGTAVLTLSDLALGSYSVTASYSGDGSFTAATTAEAVAITVTKKPMGEDDWAIEIPTGPVEIGSSNDLTVSLPADATGTVSFAINGEDPIVVNVVDGEATISTDDLPAGGHTIVIVYSGDATYAASAPQTVTITIVKKDATVTLTGPTASLEVGSDVTVVATVTPGATGTVQFAVAGVNSGAAVAVAGGSAAVTLSGLAVGSHAITAVYSGDDVYGSATAAPVTVLIVAAPVPDADVSIAAPTLSKAKQVFKAKPKQRVTVTAVVTGVTTGTVTFTSGKKTLGTAKVVKSGNVYRASLRLKKKQAVGKYAGVTASITHDGKVVSSAPAKKVLRVVKAKPKKVTVKALKVTSNGRLQVRVKTAKLTNGKVAVGRVQVRVGKKVVTTVKLTKKNKGVKRVTLPRSVAGTVNVRAKFVPKKKAKNIKAKTSKAIKVRVAR